MRPHLALAIAPLVVFAACNGRTELDPVDPPGYAPAPSSTAPAVSATASADGGIGADAPTSCECVRGESDERPCGGPPTAMQQRTCDDGCRFTAWSACAERGWIPMASPSPLHLVSSPQGFAEWTGREVFFWSPVSAREYPDTAAYDPVGDRWRLLARSPIAGAIRDWDGTVRTRAHAFADGRVWIVEDDLESPLLHAYDPSSDTWSTRTVTGFPIRPPYHFDTLHWLAATRELVALRNERPTTAFAFRVDDATVRVLEPPLPLGRNAATIGDELWVCCSGSYASPPTMLVWEPKSDTWRRRDGADPTAWYASLFTVRDRGAPAFLFLERGNDGGRVAWRGTLWDSIDDTFVDVPPPPVGVMPVLPYAPTLWSTERALFSWGGMAPSPPSGAWFEVATRRWHPMPLGGPTQGDMVTAWTGDVAILFAPITQDGMRFRP